MYTLTSKNLIATPSNITNNKANPENLLGRFKKYVPHIIFFTIYMIDV
jgi:hypothetical protein